MGVAVDPTGARVYVGSEGEGRVRVHTATGAFLTAVTVGGAASGFGTFVGPVDTGCDMSALEAALAESERKRKDAESAFSAAEAARLAAERLLAAAQQSLATAEAARLAALESLASVQSALRAASATIASFVNMVFGERIDYNVAMATRNAAQSALAGARAATPPHLHLRRAEASMKDGVAAMGKSDYQKAVLAFRQVMTLLETNGR